MKKQEPFSVSALIINKQGHILCVSRKNDYNNWSLPGGRIELNESPERAIVREVKEETNIQILNSKDLYQNIVLEDYCPVIGYEDKICVCYYINKYRGKLKQMEEGLVGWFPFEKVLQNNCSFATYNSKVLFNLLSNYKYLVEEYYGNVY